MAEGRHQGAAGGRSSLRPPDAALEPEHAPLHLRRARRDPHHRPAADRGAARAGAASSSPRSPAKGGIVLFVGTKKQARDSVKEWAERCGMPYVNHRWLGGLLTNFKTISQADRAPARAARAARRTASSTCCRPRSGCRWRPSSRSSSTTSAASRDMQRLPDAVFVIDLKTEEIAVREAERLRDPDHRPGRHQLRPDARSTT